MKLLHLSFLLSVSLGTAMAEDAVPAGNEKRDAGAPAEEQGPGPQRPGHPNEEAMEARWKKADTDGDGFISEAEFALMPRISELPEEKRAAIFRRIDKNGDGKISPEEMRQSRPRGPAPFPPLEQVDLNKDGKITFDEFQKIPFVARQSEERQHAMFDRMDRDKDGALTSKDGPPPGSGPRGGGRRGFDPKRLIQELDTNGDGAISFEEFRKWGPVKDLGEDAQEARFNEMDHNKDLKLDLSDFPAPPDRGPRPPDDEKMDHNGPPPPGEEPVKKGS